MWVETEYTNGTVTLRENNESNPGWIIRRGCQIYSVQRKDFRRGDMILVAPDKNGISELIQVKRVRVLSDAEALVRRLKEKETKP